MIRRQFDVRLSVSRRLTAVLAMAALVMGPVSASAVDIRAGFELMTTSAGTQVELPAIPAGFFGPGCNPVAAGTPLALTGDPVPAGVVGDPDTTFAFNPLHDVLVIVIHIIIVIVKGFPLDLVDTVVERTANGSVTPAAPSDVIPTEIVELSLVSASPLNVGGCNAGAGADFIASVTLDGAQAPGTLSVTGTDFTIGDFVSGVADLVLPVNYQISFEELGNPSNVVALTSLSVTLEADGTFTARDAPGKAIPVMPNWAYMLFAGLFLVLLYVYADRRRTA